MIVRVGCVAAACWTLCACASIDVEAVKAFGVAASGATTAITRAQEVYDTLDVANQTELRAAQYINNGEIVYPVQYHDTASVWALRVQFTKALGAYSTALGEALDPENVSRARAAVGSMKSILETVATEEPGKSLVGPSGDFAVSLAGFIALQSIQSQVRQIISDAQKPIEDGAKLLAIDLEEIAQGYETRYGSWLETRRASLKSMREDTKASKAALYTNYRNMVREEREFQLAQELLKRDPKTKQRRFKAMLDTMVEAHKSLLKEGENRAAILAFLEAVNKLAILIKATQKL